MCGELLINWNGMHMACMWKVDYLTSDETEEESVPTHS